jgi:hypothetical protein
MLDRVFSYSPIYSIKERISYKTEVTGMGKEKSAEDNTVIMSDEYLSESGVQGGKIIGEHIVLGSLIVGIPFLIMGLIGLFMLFGLGFPAANTANIILMLLLTVMGLLLIIGAYNIYRTKHVKKLA